MARAIAQIYEAMVADKDAQSSISDLAPTADTAQQLMTDLNSTSKVAIWRLLFYTIASAIGLHEILFDKYLQELDAKLSQGIWGTPKWYQAQSLAFQYGDTLTYDNQNYRYYYPIIDATKQIVKRCSIVENNAAGVLIFKVAKASGTTIIPLTTPEQNAFESYINKIKFAGTWIQVITGNGDLLKINYTILYDPIVPLTTVKDNVFAAINNYISNLPFDGTFRVLHLQDAIQAVEGVVDVDNQNNAVFTRLSNSANFAKINTNYIPYYGYFKIDDTAGNTLNDTINFIAI